MSFKPCITKPNSRNATLASLNAYQKNHFDDIASAFFKARLVVHCDIWFSSIDFYHNPNDENCPETIDFYLDGLCRKDFQYDPTWSEAELDNALSRLGYSGIKELWLDNCDF